MGISGKSGAKPATGPSLSHQNQCLGAKIPCYLKREFSFDIWESVGARAACRLLQIVGEEHGIVRTPQNPTQRTALSGEQRVLLRSAAAVLKD